MKANVIPLDGSVTVGQCIALGWPEPAEYDRITALRNRPQVRGCFLDPRPLDVARNREWLARGMRRPQEGLLAIRIGGDDAALCGTIGWSGLDPVLRTMEAGRLIVDARALVPYRSMFPPGYRGVALDAVAALLRFAFATLEFESVTSRFISSLPLPLTRRANLLSGGVSVGESEHVRADGSRVRITHVLLTRERWLEQQREAA